MPDKIKEYLSQIKERFGKNKLMIWGLGLVGVLLLILPSSCDLTPSPQVDSSPRQGNYQQQLQHELERILNSIEGAGRVSVMLTLDDEQEVIYAINEEVKERNTFEEDGQGGTREQVEYDSRGQLVVVRTNNQEQPVIIKVLKPRVRGVLVVASGADNPVVRQRLVHAVQAVLDVPSFRVTVQKGK